MTWKRLRRETLATATACAWCGSGDDLTVDHVIPRARGGLDTRANVQVLCRRCNSSKGTWTPRSQLSFRL